jgi:AcrR family transcriptional regulator
MQPQERSNLILQAASKLIAYYGYDKTTVEDIAREAGISKGGVYLAYPSKDALFDALLAHEMQHLLADLQKRLAADPQGGAIANLYRHSLLALQANPLMLALYTRDNRVLGDYLRRQDVSRYTDRLLLGRAAVRQMQAAGMLRTDLSPEVIAHLFTIVALGFMSVWALIPAENTPPPAEVVEGISRMIAAGLGNPAASTPTAFSPEALAGMFALMETQYQEKKDDRTD